MRLLDVIARPGRLAAIAAAGVLLVGCQSAAEEIAEGLTGADELEFEDDGSFTVETEDGTTSFQADGDGEGGTITFEGDEDGDSGSITIGGGDLPDGFPEGLPLPDGEIETSSAFSQGDDYVYNVGILADLDADAANAYCDSLVAAGYDEVSRFTSQDAVVCQHQNAEHFVSVFAGLAGDGLVTIGVTPPQG